MHDFLQDVRYGVRILLNHRLVFCVSLITLAIGIAASTVGFSVFYNLLFNAFAARDAQRLAVPVTGGVEPLICSLSCIDSIRAQNHVFEDVVGYGRGIALLTDGGGTHQLYDAPVTGNAFDFYGVPPFLGRNIGPADESPSASPVFAISYKTWINEFNADPTILGKTFALHGKPSTLIGIMPPRFQAYGALTQIWTLFGPDRTTGQKPSGQMMVRLKRGVSLAAASAELDLIVKRLAEAKPDQFPKHAPVGLQSAEDFLLGPYGIGGAGGSDYGLRQMLRILFAGVVMLLLIACINVANLLLIRTTARQKEIAIRCSLGATRMRLIRQLLTESFILASLACALGCLFAYFGMKAASAIIPQKGLSVGEEAVIGLNPVVLLFALAVTAISTFLCGLAPAFHAASGDLNTRMAGMGSGGSDARRPRRFRSALVISEVSLSFVLLIGTGLMMRSFLRLTHVDLGFNPKRLIFAAFGSHGARKNPEQQKALLDSILRNIKALPGVDDVAVNYSLPGYNGGGGSEITVPESGHTEEGGFEPCSESLLNTLRLRVLRGQWLSDDQAKLTPQAAVINQTFAQHFFADSDPIGRLFEARAMRASSQQTTKTYRIVGVVNDVKNYDGPRQPVRPMAYVPYEFSGSVILIRTNISPRSLMPTIQRQIWKLDPTVVFAQFEPLQETFERLTYSAPRFGIDIFAPLAGIGLILVIAGVFSVASYTVMLQTRNIAIRMALGARVADIIQMILRNGIVLVTTGIGFGLAVSFALTRVLASQLWGISTMDPWTFATITIVVLGAGVSACTIPARRAAQTDPMVALRHE